MGIEIKEKSSRFNLKLKDLSCDNLYEIENTPYVLMIPSRQYEARIAIIFHPNGSSETQLVTGLNEFNKYRISQKLVTLS